MFGTKLTSEKTWLYLFKMIFIQVPGSLLIRILNILQTFIAAGTWFIWIFCYNFIFKNIHPNLSVELLKAIAHVQDYVNSLNDPIDKKIILNNFSSANGPFFLTHAASIHNLQVRSIGFFITNANNFVSLIGCLSQPMNDNSSNEIFTLEVALQIALEH